MPELPRSRLAEWKRKWLTSERLQKESSSDFILHLVEGDASRILFARNSRARRGGRNATGRSTASWAARGPPPMSSTSWPKMDGGFRSRPARAFSSKMASRSGFADRSRHHRPKLAEAELGAEEQGAGRRARRGQRSDRAEEPVPGHDEPRDTDSDERHPGDRSSFWR